MVVEAWINEVSSGLVLPSCITPACEGWHLAYPRHSVLPRGLEHSEPPKLVPKHSVPAANVERTGLQQLLAGSSQTRTGQQQH